MDIVLASESPRRKDLLGRIVSEFRVYPVNADESTIQESDPLYFAVKAAVLKARAGGDAFPSAAVIGADTVVALGRLILGKPRDREHAREMLRLLSKKRHRVITGIAVFHKSEERLLTGYERTFVTFRDLSEEMIETYLGRNTYRDKAGAYAIQEVGKTFVKRLKGEYDNVVGFPLKRVEALLERIRVPPLTITIADEAFPENGGTGRDGGRTIFVPGAVPGDIARVHIVRDRKDITEAEILRLEQPSPSRIPPRCPHFGECGGCAFQHVAYKKQLELKEGYLSRTLAENGLIKEGSPLVSPITPSPDVYFYRNKMEFAFGETAGKIVLGLRKKSGTPGRTRGRTVSLESCPIFSPVVDALFPTVLRSAKRGSLSPYDVTARQGVLRHFVLREGKRTGDIMAALVTRGGLTEELRDMAEHIVDEAPRIRSFLHVRNDKIADVVAFEEIRVLYGESSIEEKIGGLAFRILPQTFFQTNTRGAELLYRRIQESSGATADSRILGLYCGTGPIEISLARSVRWITGIDSEPENIATAEANCRANATTNCSFSRETVEIWLRNAPQEDTDILILNPPRAGLSPKALKRLLALEIPSVVYVSCNPRALARDLGAFVSGGYAIRTIEPFDFFPHTPHLETLVVLQKANIL